MRTGRSLLELNSRELLSVAYYLLLDESIRTEDEQKARDQVLGRLRNIEYEAETGMPAITQWMAPANQM